MLAEMSSETIKFRQENRRKRRWREITTHIVLLLLVFIYSFFGAKLFQSIEQKPEQRAKGNLIESKHKFLDKIQLGVGSQLVDQKNWTKMVDRLLNYYVEDLAEATSHGVDITDVTQHEYESDSKWDFWGSLFYAGTVYTTIGYGNFAPVTPEGKVATIIYGTVGIPLCLILLADLGNLIAKLIKYSVKKIKKQLYTSSKKNLRELWPPQDEIDAMTGRSSFIVLCVVSLLYFGIGAAMYRMWEEDWTYLDAVYFIFVSTSTIGFGDVLPSHPKKFIISSLYVFLGLSLLSSGFTILQDLLESGISEAKKDLDTALGIQKIGQDTAETAETTPGETTPVKEEKMDVNEKTTSFTDAKVFDAANKTTEPTTTFAPNENVQEAISELLAVEECIMQKSVNNNVSATPPKFQVPDKPEEFTISAPAPKHSSSKRSSAVSKLRERIETTKNTPDVAPSTTQSGNSRVSETRLVSLDDGVLSVEATIILDQ